MTASRTRRRARLVAVSTLAISLAAIGAVSACSAGIQTQTSNQVPAVPGVNATVGPDGAIALRDLTVAYKGAEGYPQGATVPLVVRIFNDGPTPVKLVKVATKAAAGVVLVGGTGANAAPTPTPTPTPTPKSSGSSSPNPRGSAAASGSAAAATSAAAPTPAGPAGQATFAITIAPAGYALLVPGQGQYLLLTGLNAALTPGQSVPVEFTFDNGASAIVELPLVPPSSPLPRQTAGVDLHGEE